MTDVHVIYVYIFMDCEERLSRPIAPWPSCNDSESFESDWSDDSLSPLLWSLDFTVRFFIANQAKQSKHLNCQMNF